MLRKTLGYILAFAAISAVTLIKYDLPALSSHTPLLMYHLAIILTAIYFGRGPAILALGLSTGAIDYIFLHPAYYPDLHWAGLLELVIYLTDGAVMIWLIDRLVKAERRLARKNRFLQDSNDRVARMLLRVIEKPFSSYKNKSASTSRDLSE